jgi:hypothetical protein
MYVKISEYDEQRLRALATGMAQGIRDPKEILAELGFSEDDWRELERSRVFLRVLNQAVAEWNNVARTPQRVKLKAAINVEQALPQFYDDMVNASHPLIARVRTLEAVAKLAGLPEPELERYNGPSSSFKLEIHLGTGVDGKPETITVGKSSESLGIPELPSEVLLSGVRPSPVETLQAHESFRLPDIVYSTVTPEK